MEYKDENMSPGHSQTIWQKNILSRISWLASICTLRGTAASLERVQEVSGLLVLPEMDAKVETWTHSFVCVSPQVAERPGSRTRWVGEQGKGGGYSGFLEGKLGKGIIFEM